MKKLLIGNWKMNPENPKLAEDLFSAIKKAPGSTEVEVVILPPAIYIPLLKNRGITIGAQNAYFEKEGAFTGEISMQMVKNMGCKYVLIGHSERRNIFNERDEDMQKKVTAACHVGLIPIFCVGETKRQKNSGNTGKTIKDQLNLLRELEIKDLVIGYEPVWAIGSGDPCDAENAFKMKLLIKKMIAEIFDRDMAERTPIIYGGSVNLGNCQKYIQESKFNGLLVGGASLRKEFGKMISEIE